MARGESLRYRRRSPEAVVKEFTDTTDREVAGYFYGLIYQSYKDKESTKKLRALFSAMKNSPGSFVRWGEYKRLYLERDIRETFFEDIRWIDLLEAMDRLHFILNKFGSVEQAINSFPNGDYAYRLWLCFAGLKRIGQSEADVSLPLLLYARLMVRESFYDLGAWKTISPRDLICPLTKDQLRYYDRKLPYTMESVRTFTESMKKLNPEDPSSSWYALYRYFRGNREGLESHNPLPF